MNQTDIEIAKLARSLRVSPDRIDYVRPAGPDAIRRLREQSEAVLLTSGAEFASRAAAASVLIPMSFAARLTVRINRPRHAARIASEVDPKRVADLSTRLPAAFLADVAAELRGNNTTFLANLPVGPAVQVTEVLAGRADWITVARFFGAVSWSAVEHVVTALENDIVEILPYVEDTDRLNRLFLELSAAQLDAIIAAVAERDSWSQLLGVVETLTPAARERLDAAISRLDEGARAHAIQILG